MNIGSKAIKSNTNRHRLTACRRKIKRFLPKTDCLLNDRESCVSEQRVTYSSAANNIGLWYREPYRDRSLSVSTGSRRLETVVLIVASIHCYKATGKVIHVFERKFHTSSHFFGYVICQVTTPWT